MHGGSTNPLVFDSIKAKVEGKKNIVILDSDHSYDHVRKEMSMYSELVPIDSYMVVEDTHVNGNPVPWKWGDGPMEAVNDFMENNDNWFADYWCEKYMMTFNPKGYLRRIK
jgi:cephalosporin hydroxylase